MKTITVEELEEILLGNSNVLLLDVRENTEVERDPFKIIGDNSFMHIPMDKVPESLGEIPKVDNIYVLCRSGIRSRYAGEFLEDSGYPQVTNIEGGIIAWQDMVSNR